MRADPQQLRAKLAAVRGELLAALANIDPQQLDHPGAAGGWSVRHILIHLAEAEQGHRRFAQTLLAGSLKPSADFDLERWNQSRVERRAAEALPAVLARLAAERAQTLAFLETVPAEGWQQSGEHPALGPITVLQALRVIGLHERMHLQEIRQRLARRP